MVTTVEEYRARVRKEVTAPSGHVFLVRKLKQQDFVPRGLVALTIETMAEVPVEVAKAYLREHPEEVLVVEETVLTKGIVKPKVTMSHDVIDGICVDELEEQDRKFLFDTISEFSGMTELAMAAIDKFREPELDGAGADGPVLREAPVGAGPAGG